MVAADASGRAISPFEKKSKKIFEPFSLLRRLTVKRRWVASHNKEIVMFKRTIVSGLVATTVAAAMLVGTVQPSAAHHKHYNKHLGIGIAAGVGGFLLGSALAQPRTVYIEEDGGSWHVRRCLNRYQSYDPYSDTYVGYDGYRHRCHL
ncbi:MULTISPECIES: BA14K family protein [unclassified Mesorhizobium]|uniref:BA14K family protein n=2 Tax=Mesorhizobium TaxID=68287 RepID=UPI00040D8357|nr:BA14K family protein [Mesorhizobium sp. LSHC420B00]